MSGRIQGLDGIPCELWHLCGRRRNLSSVAVALCCIQGVLKLGEGGLGVPQTQ